MKPSQKYLLLLVLVAIGQASTAFAQVPRFLTSVSYPVKGAIMAALADVNGDGKLDLITANGASPTGDGGVSILLAASNGKFQPAKKIVAGGSPSEVLVADFNHDGKLDIAVANEPDPESGIIARGGPQPNSVSILLGNGDGTFQPSIDTPTLGALALAQADFNGDGSLDLVVLTGVSSPVQILLGRGDGTFAVSSTTLDGFGLLTGDFNHDGKQDFISAGRVMLGNGDGTFTLGQGLDQIPFLAADFNQDGLVDLASEDVIGGRHFVSQIALGQPGGTWAGSLISIFSGFGIVAADFDGDGKIDIFGTGDKIGDGIDPPVGGLFLGNGDGTFVLAAPGFGAPLGFPNIAAFVAAGDLDGNGSPDVVMANGIAVLVALNTAGHPPLLAQVTTSATFILGGTQLTGTVSLGGPAPAGGATVSLTSSNAAATVPPSVKIAAGATSATFSISTSTVAATTPLTISAAYHATKLTTPLTVVPAFTLSSISVAPSSLIGMFGGDAATGTITLSSPAANGTMVNITSANAAVLSVPASVTFTPGATTATFSLSAQHVTADTTVVVSATLAGTTKTASVVVRKESATVTITKAEYVVKKGQLTIEASSNDRVGNLQIFNADTGASLGTIPLVGVGKFKGLLGVTGTLTSVAAQSTVGGLGIAPVAQK